MKLTHSIPVQSNAEAKILIVDDELLIRQQIRAIFADLPYALLDCDSAEAALEQLRDHAVDVILLDIILPKMDGIALCRALRTRESLHSTVIIMLTSSDDENLISESFAAGATDYIRKPIHPLSIRARVSSALARERAHQQCWESEQRLRAILNHMAEGIITMAQNGTVQTFNATAERMFGYRASEVIGRNIKMLMPEPFRSEHGKYIQRYLKTNKARVIGVGPREVQGQRKNGEVFPMDLAASELNIGNERIFTAIIRDASQRKQEQRELYHQANFDPLTGVNNRRFFTERLRAAMSAAQRHGNVLSVCMCDMDRFKRINDRYGHAAGDQVLQYFGDQINRLLRTEDLSGRYGGDEFCFAFPNSTAAQAIKTVERLSDAMRKARFESAEGETFAMSCSFGIAQMSDRTQTMEALMDCADKALYQAKQMGRNTIRLYDSDIQCGQPKPE